VAVIVTYFIQKMKFSDMTKAIGLSAKTMVGARTTKNHSQPVICTTGLGFPPQKNMEAPLQTPCDRLTPDTRTSGVRVFARPNQSKSAGGA
jgi:hypothetical protein